jgi:mevalonate kinase
MPSTVTCSQSTAGKIGYPLTSDSYAKCIITGAHTVLRGGLAVACRIPLKLQLRFVPSPHKQGLIYQGLRNPSAENAFIQFFQHALALTGASWSDFSGEITLTNTIPLGCGLGSSAALCLTVANLFSQRKILAQDSETIVEFAKQLEHFFHGSSSGLDVAASRCPPQHITLFSQESYEYIPITWHPYLALTPTTIETSTKETVSLVRQWQATHPHLSHAVDNAMHKSSQLSKMALLLKSLPESERVEMMREALSLANHCYHTWGVVPPILQNHQQNLRNHGALASTPTGGGHGGYILSLWKEKPPLSTQKKLSMLWLFS